MSHSGSLAPQEHTLSQERLFLTFVHLLGKTNGSLPASVCCNVLFALEGEGNLAMCLPSINSMVSMSSQSAKH